MTIVIFTQPIIPMPTLRYRYYLRTKAAAKAIKFTVDQTSLRSNTAGEIREDRVYDDEEECLSCQ